MAKTKTQYACQECGALAPRWLGKCPSCEAWNSLAIVEEVSDAPTLARTSQRGYVDLDLPDGAHAPPHQQMLRYATGVGELDRVLGGGICVDSLTLVGGDPGIGKSTLLLQMAYGVSQRQAGLRILYVSGEESVDQIRGRAFRLGIRGQKQIFLAAETRLEEVLKMVETLKPQVLVMDSLQTFASSEHPSAPGSVSQVREVTARAMHLAKGMSIAVWLVGHVTKEGSIAGPKTVEHMVDTVLYFEGEAGQAYRLLRTVKNRFGSNRELGVFEMDGEGLREVKNPSALFLSERTEALSGTAIAVPLEGSRPLLVEVQALVSTSGLAIPRRTSVGIDTARISLLAAILEKHMKLPLAEQDLFFNVSGGLRLAEPACDLAAAVAIWSSNQDHPLPLHWVFIGELGLTGEVRRVAQTDLRLEEAFRLGFDTAVIPHSTPENIYAAWKNKLQLKRLGRIAALPGLL